MSFILLPLPMFHPPPRFEITSHCPQERSPEKKRNNRPFHSCFKKSFFALSFSPRLTSGQGRLVALKKEGFPPPSYAAVTKAITHRGERRKKTAKTLKNCASGRSLCLCAFLAKAPTDHSVGGRKSKTFVTGEAKNPTCEKKALNQRHATT